MKKNGCIHNLACYWKKHLVTAAALMAVVSIWTWGDGLFSPAHSMDKDQPAASASAPDIEHPMQNPKEYSKAKKCPNCGMMINMWARTRHAFHHPEGDFVTCSIRCMADKAVNSGEEPSGASVALYLDPDTMVPVEKAVYVMGSTAPGTMTMKSKIAFADRAAAEEFATRHGGEVVDFQAAYAAAREELPKSRLNIDQNRKKTGKIKEPTAADTCTVCGMYPARFPRHHAQIWAMDGSTLHFCSTRCLIHYTAEPAKYVKEPSPDKMAWVTIFSDSMYESAYGAYYVVGSRVDGPMGKEAIPFKFKKEAEDFVRDNGGRIVGYPELTPELLTGGE
ncbi:MAG: nitrous oxide reductase accessory protein NosL [Desulfobulbaceae bacterium]|nr:nitrous oxide reductase accessory protein NosL [Desulfobulbaceae bacterium]